MPACARSGPLDARTASLLALEFLSSRLQITEELIPISLSFRLCARRHLSHPSGCCQDFLLPSIHSLNIKPRESDNGSRDIRFSRNNMRCGT